MAILNPTELQELRQAVFADRPSNATKTTLAAVFQAIEDYFTNAALTGFGAAIETAAPGVFSVAQKRVLVAYYLRQKAKREGV